MTQLAPPHGGELVSCQLDAAAAATARRAAAHLPCCTLDPRRLAELELIASGACSPLRGFLGRADHEAVQQSARLADGTPWPLPLSLPLDEATAAAAADAPGLALCDPEGALLALLELADLWRDAAGQWWAGGPLQVIEPPHRYAFNHLRFTPAELRQRLARQGWRRIAAVLPEATVHRAGREAIADALRRCEANLLLLPLAGEADPNDRHHFTRVRCHEHLLADFPEATSALCLLPLGGLGNGPRALLWQAIVARNHGATHLLHPPPAEPELLGRPLADWLAEIGVEGVPLRTMGWSATHSRFVPLADHHDAATLDDAELHHRLEHDLPLPDWFTLPAIEAELRAAHPPRHRQGFTIFLTGLSGAGKSTIAKALWFKLRALGGRDVTLLDGDIVRRHLSSELGFSRAHRDLNIQRIAFVASEITRHGGIAICAPIAPYTASRDQARHMISAVGGFIEVHVDTPLAVCEARDRKGLYARARAGQIANFTGISDPYEPPRQPEVRIDTSRTSANEAANQILLKLESLGYLR